MDKQQYAEYLKTPIWELTRQAALRRAKGKCSVCHSEIDLHVHHLNYDNVGDEKPEDLIVLCECCHTLEHNRPEDADSHALDIIQRLQRDAQRREEFGITGIPF